MTIEERAKEAIQKACDKCMFRKACTQHCNDYNRYIDVCKKALKEQDRIARAEERERCIKAMQDFRCEACKHRFSCEIDERENCAILRSISKAIEKGRQ